MKMVGRWFTSSATEDKSLQPQIQEGRMFIFCHPAGAHILDHISRLAANSGLEFLLNFNLQTDRIGRRGDIQAS